MSERVKGVRDFTGREAFLRQQALETIRKAYELFDFEPIETPSFEYLSLFTNKSGPEIESQLYSFEDKKGEKLALRPEHTISKLRVVAGNKSLVFPLRAYS
ncbi:ATP phosphoribosyltransferase regulatory subunit, partial [Candidatus Parvarchaeota archaeon]|nr:ATP phosphoribosyltransferase regulatory subunit [Candidatus Parvarchaeota archaeon]